MNSSNISYIVYTIMPGITKILQPIIYLLVEDKHYTASFKDIISYQIM